MVKVMMRWDDAKRSRLREAYNAAVTAGEEEITFEEHVFLTEYAKYLLQYLDGLFSHEQDE